MEMFSLEEDDANALFITQESRNIVPLIPNFEENDGNVVESCSSNQAEHEVTTQYSDISDDDVFQIPSSQMVNIAPIGR